MVCRCLVGNWFKFWLFKLLPRIKWVGMIDIAKEKAERIEISAVHLAIVLALTSFWIGYLSIKISRNFISIESLLFVLRKEFLVCTFNIVSILFSHFVAAMLSSKISKYLFPFRLFFLCLCKYSISLKYFLFPSKVGCILWYFEWK